MAPVVCGALVCATTGMVARVAATVTERTIDFIAFASWIRASRLLRPDARK
jgi:hypothetical protein